MEHEALFKSAVCIILGSTLFIAIYLSLSENVNASVTSRSNIVNNTNSISPSFPNQEIIDPYRDWIDLKTKTFTKQGDRFTDIRAVDYYSDGKTFNAIIWLFFPPRVEPQSSYQFINYGMYIDADFDTTTGYGGIEYKYEIGWSNETKKWTRVLEKWSHFGDTVGIGNGNQTIPYTEFTKDGAQYVLLSADLDSMLSPSKYKVIFYAEAKKNGSIKTDFTRLLAIPPLELKVSTSPNQVELRKKESNTIQVTVETTQGYEPTVNLNAISQSKYLNLDFTQNDNSIINNF